jgi:hypothetical protein
VALTGWRNCLVNVALQRYRFRVTTPAGKRARPTVKSEAGARHLSSVVSIGDATAGPAKAAAYAAAERLCARVTASGDITQPARHADVALELREVVPLLDDALFDQHMAQIQRAATRVTEAETADADDTDRYADAAWGADLDVSDFPADPLDDTQSVTDYEAFRAAVIQHWDIELRSAVADLLADNEEHDPASPAKSSSTRAS